MTTLHDKVCELLHESNDQELGEFHGPRWAAFVQHNILELANEVGVDFSLDELDEVYGANAAVVSRIGDEVELYLFDSKREARLRWHELTAGDA